MSALSFPSTELSLIQRVQRDDARAWEQFVELYGPLLFYWARRGGLESVDAADVTQEAFAAIARSILRFDPSAGSLRGWMWTIVRNKVRDFYRDRPPAQAGGGTDCLIRVSELPDEEPHSETNADQQQSKAFLHRALGQVQAEFEPHTWAAFWSVVVDGQPTADVAARLGISTCSVRQAKSRVLRRLREHLGPWMAE